MASLEAGLTRDEAFALLQEHNKEAFHIEHGETVEGTMRFFAREFDSESEEFWGIVGLLHDVDWEEYPTSEDHTIKGAEMIRAAGGSEQLVHAVQAHTYGSNPASPAPELFMEKVLFAVDELTGLIGAAALMRPSKSCQDMELKSLKKKFKDKRFAAGCDREVIARGAEMLGWDLDRLLSETLEAMKACEG